MLYFIGKKTVWIGFDRLLGQEHFAVESCINIFTKWKTLSSYGKSYGHLFICLFVCFCSFCRVNSLFALTKLKGILVIRFLCSPSYQSKNYSAKISSPKVSKFDQGQAMHSTSKFFCYNFVNIHIVSIKIHNRSSENICLPGAKKKNFS